MWLWTVNTVSGAETILHIKKLRKRQNYIPLRKIPTRLISLQLLKWSSLFFFSVALEPFEPWPLFQFLNPIHNRQDSLDEGSARRKAATYKKVKLSLYPAMEAHRGVKRWGSHGI
jgi:hypothetical protein